jgi:hypothetical protein
MTDVRCNGAVEYLKSLKINFFLAVRLSFFTEHINIDQNEN